MTALTVDRLDVGASGETVIFHRDETGRNGHHHPVPSGDDQKHSDQRSNIDIKSVAAIVLAKPSLWRRLLGTRLGLQGDDSHRPPPYAIPDDTSTSPTETGTNLP